MINGFYAADYQVHSIHSHDGKASISDICQRAVEIGLDEIGFSEHKDFDPADPVVNHFNYDAYMEDITAARDRFCGRLKIRAGVEVDYQVWFEDKIGNYLDAHPFDYVLGSVHYVNRVQVMSEEYNRTRNARLAYSDYFHAVRDSVVSGLFDVLAHLEYANRRGVAAWGPYDMRPHRNDLTTIFDRMVDEGMILEINTAGRFHGVGLTYPCSDSVDLYAQRGGERICIGSDAHHPDQLGYDYQAAVDTALLAGITHLATWDKRHVRDVTLARRVPAHA
jgi:histidinol-phosphatase (PHP family)